MLKLCLLVPRLLSEKGRKLHSYLEKHRIALELCSSMIKFRQIRARCINCLRVLWVSSCQITDYRRWHRFASHDGCETGMEMEQMPFNVDQHPGSGSSCLMAKVSQHLFCFNSSGLINGDNSARLLYRRLLRLFGIWYFFLVFGFCFGIWDPLVKDSKIIMLEH